MRGFSSLFCDNGPEKPCKFRTLHSLEKSAYSVGAGVGVVT